MKDKNIVITLFRSLSVVYKYLNHRLRDDADEGSCDGLRNIVFDIRNAKV